MRGMIAALMGAGILKPEQFALKDKNPAIKVCYTCGTEYQHKNLFCSKACCDNFKETSISGKEQL